VQFDYFFKFIGEIFLLIFILALFKTSKYLF
jgi:hypothetical protein